MLLISCTDIQSANEKYLNGVKAYKEQDFEKAENFLTQAIKEKKDFFHAEYLLGKIFFFQKKYPEAEKIFRRLIKKEKHNYDYKLWLLRTLYIEEKFKEADSLISELSTVTSEDWRLYYWKAQICKHVNDYEGYFRELTAAEKLLKDSANVYLDLGLVWSECNKTEKNYFFNDFIDNCVRFNFC